MLLSSNLLSCWRQGAFPKNLLATENLELNFKVSVYFLQYIERLCFRVTQRTFTHYLEINVLVTGNRSETCLFKVNNWLTSFLKVWTVSDTQQVSIQWPTETRSNSLPCKNELCTIDHLNWEKQFEFARSFKVNAPASKNYNRSLTVELHPRLIPSQDFRLSYVFTRICQYNAYHEVIQYIAIFNLILRK